MSLKLHVKPLGVGLFYCSQGSVTDFKPRQHIPDRKSIRLMTRSVQLGIAAARAALSQANGWTDVPPSRRAFFVGASPQVGDERDLEAAMTASQTDLGFDLQQFATQGIPQIHPLWLIRGLSNNILGYGSAFWDFQGVNSNYCSREEGGYTAIVEGARAVAEGRASIALTGAADSLTAAATFLGRPCGEGAAFILWGPATDSFDFDRRAWVSHKPNGGDLGAATWAVTLAKKILSEQDGRHF